MLEVRELNACYGSAQALWDVELAVGPGGTLRDSCSGARKS